MNPLQSTRLVVLKRLALVILCLVASVFLLKTISVLSKAHSQGQERKRIMARWCQIKDRPQRDLRFPRMDPSDVGRARSFLISVATLPTPPWL